MSMNFKEFFESSYTDYAVFLGSLEPSELDKLLEYYKKLDKIIGLTKMFKLLGPTVITKIFIAKCIVKIMANPKKLSNYKELLSHLSELTKLSLMNPLVAAPAAMSLANILGIKESNELIILLTKFSSNIYFYLNPIIEKLMESNNETLRTIAKKLKNKLKHIYPKTEI